MADGNEGWQDAGFSVDPASFSGVAGQLGKSFDDFTAAVTLADGGECRSADAFGSYVSEAWATFSNAWKKEMSITAQALKELVDKTHPTVKNYTGADAAGERIVNKVAAALNGAK